MIAMGVKTLHLARSTVLKGISHSSTVLLAVTSWHQSSGPQRSRLDISFFVQRTTHREESEDGRRRWKS
jgi:hypothetical protein